MDKVTPTLQYTLEMQLLTTDGNFRQHLTIYGNTMKNWKKITMKDGAVCPNFIVTYLWNGTPRNVKRGWVCGTYWVQHKSSRNLTPFSGNFIKWIKLCRGRRVWDAKVRKLGLAGQPLLRRGAFNRMCSNHIPTPSLKCLVFLSHHRVTPHHPMSLPSHLHSVARCLGPSGWYVGPASRGELFCPALSCPEMLLPRPWKCAKPDNITCASYAISTFQHTELNKC